MAQRVSRTATVPTPPVTMTSGDAPVVEAIPTPSVGGSVTVPTEMPPEVKEVNKPEPKREEQKIVIEAQADLSAMIDKLESYVNSLKGQKDVTPDAMELMKLSCAKLLRETSSKLIDLGAMVDSLKEESDGVAFRQKGLDDAAKRLSDKSDTFRVEKDAFMKLRAMSDKEFYELVNHVAAKMKEEKAAQ